MSGKAFCSPAGLAHDLIAQSSFMGPPLIMNPMKGQLSSSRANSPGSYHILQLGVL